MGQRYRKIDDQKPWSVFSSNQDFVEERGQEPKVKLSELGDALSKLVYLKRITDGGLGQSSQPPGAMWVWRQSPQLMGNVLYFLGKITILMP